MPDIYVLRATSKKEGGIVVDTWENFKTYIKNLYSDVLFRHLYCERDEKFQQKLQKYLDRIRENPLFIIEKEDGSKSERPYTSGELIYNMYAETEVIFEDKNQSKEKKLFCQDC